MRKFYFFLLFLFACRYSSAQHIVSRLVAVAETRATITDSCFFIYKGGRAGELRLMDEGRSYDDIKYDTMYCMRATNGQYDPLTMQAQALDAQNNLLEKQSCNWDKDSLKWWGREKETYSYDAAGRISSYTHFNGNSSGWTVNQKYFYSYEGVGRIVSSRKQANIGGLKDVNLDSFMYDNGGNLIVMLQYHHNSLKQVWTPMQRERYDYAGKQKITESQDVWDEASQSWKDHFKKGFTYSGGQLLADTSMFWNYPTAGWNYHTLYTYTYNAKGKFKQKDVYAFANGWIYSGKLINEYDLADNLILYAYETSSPGSSNHVINMKYNNGNQCTYKEEYSQSSMSGWWKHYARKYYYQLISTAGLHSATTIFPLKVYPIPASSVLYIDADVESGASVSIILTDMQGEIAQQWSGKKNGSIPLPVRNIANGIYLLTVKTTTSIGTIKVEIHH